MCRTTLTRNGSRNISGALARADIHQLNLIMEILGTPRDEFMQKISSESVSMLELFDATKRYYKCYPNYKEVSATDAHFLHGTLIRSLSSPQRTRLERFNLDVFEYFNHSWSGFDLHRYTLSNDFDTNDYSQRQ